MKIFTLAPNEDWIVDRLVKEWNDGNSDIVTNDPKNADIIWLLADWCYHHIPRHILSKGKILTTVHHIVPEKFGPKEQNDFADRDAITTAYHVYNQHTYDFIRPLTRKPIFLAPYWANQNIWRKTGDKYELRKKHRLPINGYLIGSFQRDTEGHDLKSPKLEKGPDLLVKYIKKTYAEWKSLAPTCEHTAFRQPHIVLGGWRRQYVMHELEIEGIPYSFFERPAQEVLNELYQTLDVYPVTARHEGGPQALLECGLIGVPTVSRSVGIAEQVLPPSAINSDVFLAQPAVPNVESMLLPGGFKPYLEIFESLHRGEVK
jgi:hypothetical protein